MSCRVVPSEAFGAFSFGGEGAAGAGGGFGSSERSARKNEGLGRVCWALGSRSRLWNFDHPRYLQTEHLVYRSPSEVGRSCASYSEAQYFTVHTARHVLVVDPTRILQQRI